MEHLREMPGRIRGKETMKTISMNKQHHILQHCKYGNKKTL